jgi:hypothetical protein
MDKLADMNSVTTTLGSCDLGVSGQLATYSLYHRTAEPKAFCKCAKCGEMAKVDTSMVLTSYPTQYSYYCGHCGHHGYTFCDAVVYCENDTEIDTDNQVILTTCLICGETITIPAKPNYNKNVICDKCKKAVLKIRAMEDQVND